MLFKWLTTLHYLRPDEGAGGGGDDTSDTSTTTTTADDSASRADDGGNGEDRTVPLQALHKERERVKSLQARLDAMDAKAKEAERAKLDEVERLRLEAKEAKDQVQSLTEQMTTASRQSLIRKAAAAANFIDAEDAVSLINAKDIEDDSAAERAVKELAKKKKHLVGSPAGGSGGPRKVLENGKTVSDEDSSDTFSQAELKSFSQEEYGALMSDPKGAAKVERSLKAIKAAA